MYKTIAVLLFISFIITAINNTSIAQSGNYYEYFDNSWSYRTVQKINSSLTSDNDYRCQVKAYGWKIIDTEYRKNENDWFFQWGDK